MRYRSKDQDILHLFCYYLLVLFGERDDWLECRVLVSRVAESGGSHGYCVTRRGGEKERFVLLQFFFSWIFIVSRIPWSPRPWTGIAWSRGPVSFVLFYFVMQLLCLSSLAGACYHLDFVHSSQDQIQRMVLAPLTVLRFSELYRIGWAVVF